MAFLVAILSKCHVVNICVMRILSENWYKFEIFVILKFLVFQNIADNLKCISEVYFLIGFT
uniref:Ovule protein n=1 Tax=Brugia timori TaxID=42155 RepID=A0A0R3QHS3_9BILA